MSRKRDPVRKPDPGAEKQAHREYFFKRTGFDPLLDPLVAQAQRLAYFGAYAEAADNASRALGQVVRAFDSLSIPDELKTEAAHDHQVGIPDTEFLDIQHRVADTWHVFRGAVEEMQGYLARRAYRVEPPAQILGGRPAAPSFRAFTFGLISLWEGMNRKPLSASLVLSAAVSAGVDKRIARTEDTWEEHIAAAKRARRKHGSILDTTAPPPSSAVPPEARSFRSEMDRKAAMAQRPFSSVIEYATFIVERPKHWRVKVDLRET